MAESGTLEERNTYVVKVRASDDDGGTHTVAVTVKVTNVEEDGTIDLRTLQPKVGVTISPSLTDPDGRLDPDLFTPFATTFLAADAKWQWATSTDPAGPWTDIKNATTTTYKPHKRDIGSYLRVTAVYSDGHGVDDPTTTDADEGEDIARMWSANVVLDDDYTNKAPIFPDQDPDTPDRETDQKRDIKEDAMPGDPVGDPVVAMDKGADGTDENLFYSLAAATGVPATDDDNFTIHSGTGQISVAAGAMLNHEDATNADRQYRVTVTAIDPSGTSTPVNVTIRVLDVKEKPKLDEVTSTANVAAITLPEIDSTDDTAVANVFVTVSSYTATDDEDDSGTDKPLKWSLSGADDDWFQICEGATVGATCDSTFAGDDDVVHLRFKEARNYEARSNRTYRVKVTVADSDGMTDFRDVAVTIANVEEAGTVRILNDQPQVGTSITAELSDPDVPVSSSIRWQWATSTSDSLGGTWNDIDDSSARTKSYRPRASDAEGGGVHLRVTVTYTDGMGKGQETPPPAVASANAVKAADPDNNIKPVITVVSPPWTVTEPSDGQPDALASAQLVGNVTITDDCDGDVADVLTYTLEGADKEFFSLADPTSTSCDADSSRVQHTVGVSLVAGTELDADTKGSYKFTVAATDPSNQKGTASVTVNVDNVNEAPVIAASEATFSYPENADRAVETFTAKDPEKSTVIWSLSGNDAGDFTIKGGVLKFKSPPNFEEPTGGGPTGTDTTYSVTIVAGDSSLTATWDLTINVTQVDEDGVIDLGTLQPKVGTEITATLTDPESDSPSPLTWQWATSTSETATSWNDIEGETSNTYTPRASDTGYFLRVTATYGDTVGIDNPTTFDVNESVDVASATTTNQVLVADYENKEPAFPDQDPDTAGSQTDQMRWVFENAERGDIVGPPVVAKDKGADGSYERLIYALGIHAQGAGTDPNSFDINRSTGQITVKTSDDDPLDYEADDEYIVTVTATDPSTASTSTKVTINILDMKEAPKLAKATATANLAAIEVEENTATTSALSTYTATDDEDDAANPEPVLKWKLSGADKDMFQICEGIIDGAGTPCDSDESDFAGDEDVVHLRFKEVPDFEARSNSVYNVTVEVTDSDDMTTTRNVAVTVTNKDDDGKVTLSNVQPEVGTPITATLTDPDGGVTDVTWQWYSGAENSDVDTVIPNATSRSYTPAAANVDQILRATASYRDDVRPRDVVGTPEDESLIKDVASTTSALEVVVMAVGNQPPVFNDLDPDTDGVQNTQATRKVAERSSPGTHVGSPVQATDERALTYTLEGPDSALFTIDNDDPDTTDTDEDGQIKVRKGTMLDYEARTTYRVTVKATDASRASASASVTIEVVNVNEAPKVSAKGLVVSGAASVSYAEDRTDAVATYTARGDEAAGVSWNLSGDDSSAFSIAGGVLSFNSQPNFEAPADADTDNVYNVTVRAVGATISASRDVVVTVTNVDEDGTATITPSGQPRVDVELTAALTDIDGTPTAISWQWSRSTSNTGGWSNIAGGRQANYTPTVADEDNYLRATASYTDPQGSGKSESAVTSAVVLAASTEGTPGTVALTPSTQLTSGDSVTATLTDADNPVNQTWRWARSSTASGTFTNISNATSASYTTTNADAGSYLRATVTYDDDSGTGKTADATTNAAIASAALINAYDGSALGGNEDGIIQIGEAIKAVQDFFAQRISIGDAIEVVQLYFAGLRSGS